MPIYDSNGSTLVSVKPYDFDGATTATHRVAYDYTGSASFIVFQNEISLIGTGATYNGSFVVEKYLRGGIGCSASASNSSWSAYAQTNDAEHGATGPYTIAVISTASTVPTSKYKKLHVYWTHNGFDQYITHGGCYFGVAGSTGYSDYNGYPSGKYYGSPSGGGKYYQGYPGTSSGTTTNTFDISDVNTDLYITAIAYSGSAGLPPCYGSFTIHKIWME